SNKLPTEADVVVIGAGSVGCSTAYHLAKLGGGKVILLEKSRITSGTTWHTAGILWSFRSTESETIMQLQTRELISKILPEETGEDAGWLSTGTLNTAKTKDQLKNFLKHASFASALGVDIFELMPNDISKLHPLLNTKDLYGAVYSPQCGTIDPATYCMSYVKAGAKYGLKTIENCSVNKINVESDYLGLKRVASVETDLGTIKTSNIVNCAGAWAPYIGKTINEYVPQLVFKHCYVVTEPIEGILGTPIIKDHGTIYMKPQGNAIQFGGYEFNPILEPNLPKDFAFGLYDMDWDLFSVHSESAVNRIPAVEKTGIHSTVNGPESFTADGHPNMGESPTTRGYFHGSAFNSGGIMNGGAGRQLAHWVIHGKPEINLANCDIRRYPTGLANPNKWLSEKSHEKFAKRYSLHYPHDHGLGGRNQRKGRLFQEHSDAGALFESKFGFERPAYFVKDENGQPQKNLKVLEYDFYGAYDHKQHETDHYCNECRTCRNSVAVFDSSYMGKLYISGKDADETVTKLLTRDITNTENQFVYSLMLNKDAGIECDVVATKMNGKSGEYYITVPTAAAQHCRFHIQKLIQDHTLHSSVQDRTEETSILSVQGPKSGHVLYALTKNKSVEALKYAHLLDCFIFHLYPFPNRLSFVGELGFEIHCSSDHVNKIYAAVMEVVNRHNGCMAGSRAMASLSTEAGFHHWPTSINSNDNPIEARLLKSCSPGTTYLGGEALEKLRSTPNQKLLACFTIDSKVPMTGSEIIWRNNKKVGFLCNADYSYSLETSIGYGYVKIPSVTDNTITSGDYEMERMGEKYPAKATIATPYLPQLTKMFA
uniref:FAD dependent oxidoreductase domain-containing protein n=1 Tax=Ciona savignyi TaxID=51511 RepID=H2ZAI4_CIOSA